MISLNLKTRFAGLRRWWSSKLHTGLSLEGSSEPLKRLVESLISLDVTERRVAEQALEAAADRYAKILRATKDSFWLVEGASGKLLDVNDAAVTLSGYSRDELLAMRIPDLDVHFSFEQYEEKMKQVLAEGGGLFETRHRTKSGRIIDVEVSTLPDRQSQTLVAFVRDITERKQTEQAIRQLNAELEQRVAERTALLTLKTEELAKVSERLQLAIEVTRHGVWEWRLPTNDLYWTPSTTEMLGYGHDEFSFTLDSWLDLVHPDDRETVQHTILESVNTTGAYEIDYRLRARDGSYRWMLERGRVVDRDAGGAPVRVVGTIVDITERRESEERLRFSEERLRLAVNAARLGVWRWDIPNNHLWLSATGLEIFGLAPDTQPTVAIWSGIVHPQDRESVRQAIVRAKEDGVDFSAEYRVLWPDGSEHWVADTGRCYYDSKHHPWHMEGVYYDITGRKRAEQVIRELNASLEQKVAERTAELAAASAAKSEFLAHMSHEIRTPMNAILGLTQLLAREGLLPEQQEMIRQISESGDSLLHIINDILDFSRIEAGQLRIDSQPFDLAAVLNRIHQLLQNAATAKGLDFQVAGDPVEAGALSGDALRLEQILLNLTGNAIKFTEQGSVILAVMPLPDSGPAVRLRFEVRDTGIGIAQNALARLFQPFSQADASITRRFGGTGLGLAISKRLVELMGGQLGVASEVGKGSTFWFEIPFAKASRERKAPATAKPQETRPPGPRLTGVRVLAVDDNRINLAVVERALKREGVIVTLAADGQQALQILRAQPAGFDVVLMDVQMPVLDGLSATRAIRSELGLTELPVIAFTAGVLDKERQQALAAGVNDFLAKPVDLETMAALLRRWTRPAAMAEDGPVPKGADRHSITITGGRK